MGKNHVVLAYGYEDLGTSSVLRIYDPNFPMRDDITIKFETSHADHTTDFIHSVIGTFYGFFAMDWYTFRDPSVVSVPRVGIVRGRVTTTKAEPIVGAYVLARGGAPCQAKTDAFGNYAIETEPGPYSVSVTASNFEEKSESISVEAQKTVVLNFVLDPEQADGSIVGEITGLVNGVDAGGVTITVLNVPGATTKMKNDCSYAIGHIPPGTHSVLAWGTTKTPPGKYNGSASVQVLAGKALQLNLELEYTQDPFGGGAGPLP